MATRTVAALAVAMALLVLGAAGCTDGSEIENVEWRLVGSSVSSSDLGSLGITATFADGQVGGHGGVNSYSASCTIRGAALEVGDVTATLMAGPESANIAESAYFALLSEAASYRLEGDTLTLMDASGNDSLIYER